MTAKPRYHFVFVKACGCPCAVRDQDRWCPDEDAAWRTQYLTRNAERAAHARGVRVVHVDHDTYSREVYPLMLQGCPHPQVADG